MNKLMLALMGGLLCGHLAQAGQADAKAMKKCNDEATAQGLVDQAERKTFITECLVRQTRNADMKQQQPGGADKK